MVVILGLIALPLVLIWALNTLFSMGIMYTAHTWLAALLVILIFSGKRRMRCFCCNSCSCVLGGKN